MQSTQPRPPSQAAHRITDIFDVEPSKMCIGSRSHAFVTVMFTPQAIQTYQCLFEATLDGLPRYHHLLLLLWQNDSVHAVWESVPAWSVSATLLALPVPCSNLARSRGLVFDIIGEGTLPRVTVIRPTLYNQHGNPLLLFKRLLLGHSEKLPLILKNNGTIPAQVTAEGDIEGYLGDMLVRPDCLISASQFLRFQTTVLASLHFRPMVT